LQKKNGIVLSLHIARQHRESREKTLKAAMHLEARRVLAERPFTCSSDEFPH